MDFVLPFLLIELVVRLVGLWLAGDAVMTGRTPQGALAWALALLLLPELAIPFYLVFGTRRFVGYVRARRRGKLGSHKAQEDLVAALTAHRADPTGTTATNALQQTLERLTPSPTTTGNHVQLLIDGQAKFDALFAALAAARSTIVAEYYIINDDDTGRRFMQCLIDAVARGVRVYLIYDAIGSWHLSTRAIRKLTDAGVQVVAFRSFRTLRGLFSLLAPWRRLQLNFRNHRKIVVIDGEHAFIGGINIGDEYIGKDKRLSPWRDTHLSIRGPAALCAQLAWAEDWYCSLGHLPELHWHAPTSTPTTQASNARVLVVPSGPADELETCGLMINSLITAARQRVWIATPYFVPDEATTHALQLAALRGVDVRVIIPDRYDQLPVWLSAFTYYEETIPTGVRILRYKSGFMHQKVILCDDIAAVGTANIDSRSFRINFEITAVVDDAHTATAVKHMLEKDMERCHGVSATEFSKKPWWFRLLCKLSRLAAPIQ